MSRKLHELSDDELSKLTAEDIAEMSAAETEDETNTQSGDDDNTEEDDGIDKAAEEAARLAAEEAAAVAAKANDDDEDLDQGKESTQTTSTEAGKVDDDKAVDGKKTEAKADVKADAKVEDKTTEAAINYEAEYKALLAPFKANGREIQVANMGEARQLMQMGANYNKKMQAMKPHLATLRTLENAKISDEDLSFLIDLHRKDPTAINKLVKDSGIDPMDITAEKAADYKPSNHKASEAEVELEAVLADLDGSEGLPKTINVITTQWDAKSKDLVAQNPQVLRTINNHVELGIYDLVAAEVERKRTFGQLTGLSDFDAYRQVGDEMNESGKFAHLTGSSPKSQQAPAAQIVDAPNPKKADDDKRKEQKRSAAPVKATAPTTKNPDFNPLSVSDEDFAKLTIKT